MSLTPHHYRLYGLEASTIAAESMSDNPLANHTEIHVSARQLAANSHLLSPLSL